MNQTRWTLFFLGSMLCLALSFVPNATAAGTRHEDIVFLGEPLSTFGATPSVGESDELRRLTAGLTVPALWKAPASFDDYLARHPSGAWTASLQAHLGAFYRRSGFFTRALGSWSAAWESLRAPDDPAAQRTAADVLGNLIELNAALGRVDALPSLLAEGESRGLTGHAREQFAGAKQAIWMMENQPEASFRCGPIALYRVLRDTRASDQVLHAVDTYPSTSNGTSLAMLQSLAAKHGVSVVAIRRRHGAPIPVPSIIHWRSGHFAAVVSARDGLVEVADPTFGQPLWIPREALEDESSGHHLVLAGLRLERGWTRIGRDQAERIWGKGNTGPPEPGATAGQDPKKPKRRPPRKPPCQPASPPPAPVVIMGMTFEDVHVGLVSLNLMDTPVAYSPPRGPSIPFTVTYNSREAYQPSTFNFSNLGGRWISNWVAYVEDNPSIAGGTVRLAERGGGSYFYSGYNASTGKYAVNRRGSNDVLRRINAGGYSRRFPDGTEEIYSVTDNGTSVRKLFLSTVKDPSGNTLTLLYDQTIRTRITAIRDGLGRSMTIEYGLPGDPYKITRAVDPFGRAATFSYDANGRLAAITDTGGYVSRFTYGPTTDAPSLPLDFINQLETPYGITRFRMGESGTRRWIETTDAAGLRERVEFMHQAEGIAASTTHVPAGFGNDYLHYRNTFYWASRAMQYYSDTDPERYRKATVIYHWMHNGTGPSALASTEPESVAELGHRRIWFAYPGQSSTYHQGTLSSPTVIARVLDDGSEQRHVMQYSALGTLLRTTDPVGRRLRFVWDSTETDLLEVYSDSDIALPERLAKYEYNAAHNPIRYTNLAGQLFQYAYNSFGQLTTITQPDGSTINTIYNSIGLPTEINRSGGDRQLFSWDALDRLSTYTDATGFSVTIGYDFLDRVEVLQFQDGTSERFVYDRFDVVEYQDRHGGVLSLAYDTVGNVVSARDRAGRVVQYEWCGCGSLEKLIDARGNETTWFYDDHERVVSRYVAGQLAHQYNYDSAGRVLTRRDGRGQIRRYEYTTDGYPRRITYPNASETTPALDYFYDSRYPRLNRMIDGLGETLYTWNPVGALGGGNLASIDGPFANDTIAFQYDSLGRVTRLAINDVESVQTYDSLGRLTSRRNALGTFTPAYNGTTPQITGVAYPNGQRTSYSHYGAERLFGLRSMRSERLRGGVWELLSSFEYDYLLNGRTVMNTITSMMISTNDPGSARQTTFDYDAAWQLIGSRTTSQGLLTGYSEFGYDVAGNRISEDVNGLVSVAAHDEGNRLTQILRQLDQPSNEEIRANQQKARALAKQAVPREGRDQ